MRKLIPVILTLACLQARADDPYKLAAQGDHEKSDILLKQIKPTQEDFNKYAFYRGVNAFAMNNKAEAKKWLEMVWDSFDKDIPRRYRYTAGMLLNDLDNWQKDDLGDISRDMKHSGHRLDNGYGGDKTQQIQKDIVSKLDKKIKELEDKGGDKDQASGRDQKQGPGGQGQPAQDSNIMGGSGRGRVDEKALRKIAENWGTMPPAERQKVIQEISRDLPPKYKPMIEEYFKALNRTGK
jgi:hypothetical protein